MTNKNYDSEFCGRVPLHHINQIQPYGYLLVLSVDELTILQASENVNELFGSEVRQVVGQQLSTFILPEQFEALKLRFSNQETERLPFDLTITASGQETECIALMHLNQGCIIAELEKSGSRRTFSDVFQIMKFAIADIKSAHDLNEICQKAVVALKKISGFDRVLLYQFDSDWNGTVLAEEKEEDMDPYLGLKFPASDIPKQARALYLKNPYRLIPNREDKPVRVYPVLNPFTNSFIDLTGCNLRSVAGVHLEYMANMGIKASMSIRIIRNEQLWGIISCHHCEPKYLSYELCSVFELLSEIISSKITSVLYKEQFNYKSTLWNKKSIILEKFYNADSLLAALLDSDEAICDLFSATGLAIVANGKLHLKGECPEVEEIRQLVFWLQHKELRTAYATSSLPSEFEQASGYLDVASGLLTIPIGNKNEDFILLLRPEVQTTVNWGGNPSDAIRFESDGKKYHPRNSFAIWQETVKETASRWSAEELELAESMRSFIFEYSTKYTYT